MKPRITFFMQDLGSGGAQRHTVGLIHGLQEQFEFSVVIQDSVIDAGITGQKLVFAISKPSIDECNSSRLTRWTLACQRIAETKPDLVVCINQIAMLVGILGRWRGIIICPITTIFHSTNVGNVAGWLRTLPYIPVVRISDGLFYISENQRRIWQKRGLSARRVWTIRNGIDPIQIPRDTSDIRKRIRANYGLSDSDFVIGCLAMFRYEKNHLQQIDALAGLRAHGLPAKLLLVGDGPMRSQIEARITETSMTEYVVLAGMQSNVSNYIVAMDIGWITSLSIETLSLAALESMALGVPMVMSNIGGASEIIETGVNGYLFPAGDTSALITCVRSLIEPQFRQRVAEAAEQTVQEHFNSDQMLVKYAGAFNHLLQGALKPC